MEGRDIDIKGQLARIASGERDAFADVYKMYAGKCAGFVLSLTGNEETAKDITHDVFMKVWVKRSSLAQVRSFDAYLMTIARNLALDRIARQKVSDRFIQGARLLQDGLSNDVEERMSESEVLHTIRRYIRSMPPQRRKIFLMSRLQGLSNPQIATLLGLSIRTVETHISHSLAGLRKALDQQA